MVTDSGSIKRLRSRTTGKPARPDQLKSYVLFSDLAFRKHPLRPVKPKMHWATPYKTPSA
jgi:hypothetical protein